MGFSEAFINVEGIHVDICQFTYTLIEQSLSLERLYGWEREDTVLL